MSNKRPGDFEDEGHINKQAREEDKEEMSDCVSFPGFEGPEKVLEMWFARTPEQCKQDKEDKEDGRYALLAVSQDDWADMLQLVHCTIINRMTNGFCDAYVLSESSLFVYPYKILLKTCGTTTLLHAIPKLLDIAKTQGLTLVDDLFYSRQSFFFPERQLHPHRSFLDEVSFLDSFFNHGAAYCIGKLNGNHFNVYNAEHQSKDKRAFTLPHDDDITLEMLMTGLDPTKMQHFYKTANKTSSDATKNSGIADLFPGAMIDDYLFDPLGYSMNGLLGEGYFTIHITPQKECSFVSFETNIPLDDYTTLINKVLECFRPSQFIVVMYTHVSKPRLFNKKALEISNQKLTIVDDCMYKFDTYTLYFTQMNTFKSSTAESVVKGDTKFTMEECEMPQSSWRAVEDPQARPCAGFT